MVERLATVSLKGRKFQHNGCLDNSIWTIILVSILVLRAPTQRTAKMIRAEFRFKVSHSFDGLKVNHKSVFTIRASTKNSTIKGYSGFNISKWYG